MNRDGIETISLESTRQVDRRGKTASLVVIGAGSIALAVEAGIILVLRFATLERVASWTEGDSALVLGLLLVTFAAALGLLTTSAYLPGVTEIRISDAGLGLRYSNDRLRFLRWGDPGTRFELRDFSEFPRFLRQNRGYHLFLPTVPGAWTFHRNSVITREAFEALLQGAKDHNSAIRSFKGSSFPNGFRPIVHRVKGSPN